jgi:hypothetical protein
MPLSSKLEVLALRPYKHLDWDPDSLFNHTVDPIPAVAYEELETRQGRSNLWSSLVTLFPALKTIIIDLHYDRVLKLNAAADGGFAEVVEKELDEELWMSA